MPRFTNSQTGVVVNVDEDTAAQLGPEWAAADGSKSDGSDAKTTTRRRKAE